MEVKRVVIFGWSGSVHVQRWARGLTSRGVQVKVISLGDDPIQGIETVNLPRTGKFAYFKYAGLAAAEAKKFRPDIINVHYAAGFGIWLVRTGFRPSVVSVWGTDVVDLPDNPLFKAVIKRTLRKADAIAATSRNLRDAVIKVAPATERKICVIPFGVNVPDAITALPPLPPLRLCFIKNHKMIYGPDVLLRAIARVKKKIPDVQVSIASEGEATELIIKMMVDLDLQKNVTLTGQIDNKDINAFIAKHHMMIMPSLREAFGVAALDASASGRPVIASRIGGIPEVVVDGETGILVPPGDVIPLADAIIKLAGEPDTVTRMGRAGYEFVKANYTWEKSLDMMIDLYERLIRERKKSS